MAENSGIEWTNHTFNPWRGCARSHTMRDGIQTRTRLNDKKGGDPAEWPDEDLRIREFPKAVTR